MQPDPEPTQEDPIELMLRIRSDVWEFSKYVYTLDETDETLAKKRYPYHKPHIRLSLKMMQMEKKILFPKVRRMQMTWSACIFILWDAMFHAGRFNAVCSKKQEDAEWLLKKRLKFIYDNLDPVIPRHLLPRLEPYADRLEFPDLDSTIKAFPQGEHQLRQFTVSNIFADEAAFWEEAEGTFGAAKPTLDGGGRFIGISTPAPGFFKKMVFDDVDVGTASYDAYTPKAVPETPIEGVRVWKNPKNRFTIVELHYTADPDKRSPEYKAEIRSGMPYARYMQEYELAWDVYEGMPVFPDFQKRFHGVDHEIHPHAGLPLLVGLDFGLTPALLVAQLQEERLVLLREYVEVNMGAKRFLELVTADLRIKYPLWASFKEDYLCFIDPSGFAKKDTDETTCAQIVGQYFKPMPGEIAFEKRKESVEHYLTKVTKGHPGLVVSLPNCEVLVRGFEGGYRYPEKFFGDPKPVKDEHSHVQDALQMITSRIKVLAKQLRREIPRPKYTLQREGYNGQDGGRTQEERAQGGHGTIRARGNYPFHLQGRG